jgi:hypothetical protein
MQHACVCVIHEAHEDAAVVLCLQIAGGLRTWGFLWAADKSKSEHHKLCCHVLSSNNLFMLLYWLLQIAGGLQNLVFVPAAEKCDDSSTTTSLAATSFHLTALSCCCYLPLQLAGGLQNLVFICVRELQRQQQLPLLSTLTACSMHADFVIQWADQDAAVLVCLEEEEGLQGVFKRLRRNGHQLEKGCCEQLSPDCHSKGG